MKNMNSVDRIFRLFIAIVLFELSFFWLTGLHSIIGYAIAAVMTLTSAIGFCPLYKPFGICTLKNSSIGLQKKGKILSISFLLVSLVGGSILSIVFSRNMFLKDFNTMNNYYKQALFQTGQNNRDKSVDSFKSWIKEFTAFESKYTSYKPFAIRSDSKWNADMKRVADIIGRNSDLIATGDLHDAHLALEKVRPIFQEAFKRNGFSMLSLALVDFHDTMELILDAANEKNSAKVVEIYSQTDEKLKAVEQIENDSEIQTIRQNLDVLLKIAKDKTDTELPAKAAELKSSFIKVYLKRG